MQEVQEFEANGDFEMDKRVQIRVLQDKKDNQAQQKDSLIFHVHGGGFIAMSSGSHQNYTRIWAKNMPRAVICSIDYRLSPKSRFPDALDDVWQAYFWLILNCKDYFGFEPKNVVLVGDSAGGNLIGAMTNLIIQRGFRLPTGLVPCYPCTMVSVQEFWPSLLLALDDLVVSQSFLNTCVMSYIPPGMHNSPELKYSDLVSPRLANHKTLAQYPPVRLMIASLDPFKDDNYDYMHRLIEAGAPDVQAKEFQMMTHGFLSQHMPVGAGLEESQECIRIVGQALEDLFE